jgi:hypothetical protein
MLEFLLAASLVLPQAARQFGPDSSLAVQLCAAEIRRRGGSTEHLKWLASRANGRVSLRTAFVVPGQDGPRRMNMQCLAEGDELIEAISVEALEF